MRNAISMMDSPQGYRFPIESLKEILEIFTLYVVQGGQLPTLPINNGRADKKLIQKIKKTQKDRQTRGNKNMKDLKQKGRKNK